MRLSPLSARCTAISLRSDTSNCSISGVSSKRMAALMRSAISHNALALPISAKDVLRAAVFRNMLVQVFKNLEEEKRDDV